jgi:glutamate transport system substrate-binding protein
MRIAFKHAAVIIATLGLLVGISGCGSSDESGEASSAPTTTFPDGTTMAAIQKRGTLRVGIKYDAPLFGLKDPRTGDLTGFDAEIGRIIAKNLLGSPDKIEFIETSSKNRELFLSQDRVDIVLATYSITPERERVVDFAGPYYQAGKALLVRRGDPNLETFDQLAGKQICTVEGTTDEELLRSEAPDASVVVFDAWSLCAEALRDNRVDAVLSDNTVLLALMQGNPDTFEFGDKTLTEDFYGIGIRNDDRPFRTYLNEVLQRAEQDGDWEAAYVNTVGVVEEEVPTPPAIAPGQ